MPLERLWMKLWYRISSAVVFGYCPIECPKQEKRPPQDMRAGAMQYQDMAET